MPHLTTAQIDELVDNGSILRRLEDGVYQFHKFSGTLDGMYYECCTPNEVDLTLDDTTSLADAVTAFKTHFATEDHKGAAPVITDETEW